MYTSQGYMTHEDYQEYLTDTDNGTTSIDVDEMPEWDLPVHCPICGEITRQHMITVQDASGEIIACENGEN